MGFISPLTGNALMLVTFVVGAVPPNMLSTYFNTEYVKPGSSAQEKCQAGGDPKPTYIWKKDGVVLSTDAYYEINSSTGDIKIKSVTAVSGEGTYQCFAQNSQGTALSGFWEVKVAGLSDFDHARTTIQPVDEYSYFSMPCKHQPSSVPASELDWLVGAGDNTAFPVTPEDKRRIVMDADGTLHFLSVRASDNANNPYRCQLFNEVVSIKAVSLENFYLNVIRVPELTSKPILKYSKSVEGTIGSKATLLCIFAGNPIPNVEWLKGGLKLPDESLPVGTSRYQIDPEDSTGRKLIISKLEIKDEGDYICRATNSNGMKEGTVKVTVTGPPQWNLERLRSTRIPVGATAKFQCDTVSYHATSSLPMWMKNGEPMIGCGMKKLWCGDGTGCYDYNKKCDGKSDCPGIPSADEQNCPALDTCGEGQFSCGGGECINATDVIRCDGTPQCLNGGDESVRHCGCKVNTDFMCADLKKCVSGSKRCNKHEDCADGSDEKRCAYEPEKVIDNKFLFSADLRHLTIPNVKKIDTMCLQCLVYNFRECGPNLKPDIVGIIFDNVCLTVLDPIVILTGLPNKQKVQRGDIINFTISVQTDPLEQGNLRYDWYIGGKKYPDSDQFSLGIWSQIIKLNIDNTHIVIDTSTLTSHDDRLFQQLMGNLSVRVYHEFDQRTISTELFTEPPPDIWYIFLIIGILILFIIVAVIVCYLYRNHGGNYPDSGQDYRLQRIAKVLNEQNSVESKVSDTLVLIPLEKERTESLEDSHAAVNDQNAEVIHHQSSEKTIDRDLSSATNQQEESTVNEQGEFVAHHQEENTAHEQDESTAHEQEESTAHQKEEDSAHEQDESTAHQQKESTAHEQDESTVYQQEESSAHEHDQSTARKQKESTAHQHEESTAHQQEESTVHQQEHSSSHQQDEYTAYQQEESSAHEQDEFTTHQQEELSCHEQDESTAHQREQPTAHEQDESTAHLQEDSSAHEQDESTAFKQEESSVNEQSEYTAHQQEESSNHEQDESTAHQQEESTVHQQEQSSSHQQDEYTAHQQEEYSAHEQDKSTARKQEESTAHQQEKSSAHEQDESTAHQQEESSRHEQDESTAHQREQPTAHEQDESTAHLQEDSSAHEQDESTAFKQEESSVHEHDEYTAHQQEESSAHEHDESTAHQQEESTVHEQEESTAHEQDEFTSHKDDESTAHEQDESNAHQQQDSSAHELDESTARKQEESTAHQQKESSAHEQDESTAHVQEKSSAHEQDESTAHQQEESTAHERDESTVHEHDEFTAHEDDESSAHEQDESTARKQKEFTAHPQEGSSAHEQDKSSAHLQEESSAHEQNESTAHQQEESTAHEQEESTAHQQEESSSAVVQKKSTRFKTNTIAMIKLLKENVNKIEGTGEDSLLTIWDFAGQYAFYTTHQTFLTRRAIYLLVSDVSGQVTDLVADDCYFDSKGIMNRQVHELVEVWLNSIHSCASSPEADSPPVILVGTHVDKIPQGKNDEVCKRYFREIRSYLKDKPTRFHLIDEDFAIDNTVVDRKVEDLKRKIVEIASQQPYWGEKIPARWLPLEQELMRLKASGVMVISRKDVEKINEEGTVQIENSEELDLFLRYLHETGTIIYFSIEILRENIVLDPTWLVDALKTLINAQDDLPEGPADNVVSQKWSDFKGKGILSIELIDAVWTKEKYPKLHDHKDHMLLIMEQLNIIAKPRAFSEIGEKSESYFLTPCMLRQKSPREIISPEQDPMLVSTPVLCCVFTGKFLPPPIFHRLIAACVTRWPVAKKKETSENLIFCGCCVFNLDLFHRLTLHCKNHIVFARITRLVVDEVKTPDAVLCTRVRKFITLNLSKITSYLSQNLKYELCTWWSPSQEGFSEGGIAVPFQMWLADEGHDSDAPIMPEHMNHARLYVALVTVCTNALRDILLTHVPEPYTNIYKTIRAKKADLTKKTQTRRGQWQNALLLPDQCQLVFPDPFGRYVASVDQFDISLLYILIRNVSTVSASLMDWGIDPIEHPFRDTCLGASVERIRSYRNQIGHSMDGKMSRHEFDVYWNKIDAVLDDIEQALGRQGYRAQLEKQRRQVISVYEAC